jgi:hypothetical protein
LRDQAFMRDQRINRRILSSTNQCSLSRTNERILSRPNQCILSRPNQCILCGPNQCISSRREERIIAQGETLGKRPNERSQSRRDGANLAVMQQRDIEWAAERSGIEALSPAQLPEQLRRSGREAGRVYSIYPIRS